MNRMNPNSDSTGWQRKSPDDYTKDVDSEGRNKYDENGEYIVPEQRGDAVYYGDPSNINENNPNAQVNNEVANSMVDLAKFAEELMKDINSAVDAAKSFINDGNPQAIYSYYMSVNGCMGNYAVEFNGDRMTLSNAYGSITGRLQDAYAFAGYCYIPESELHVGSRFYRGSRFITDGTEIQPFIDGGIREKDNSASENSSEVASSSGDETLLPTIKSKTGGKTSRAGYWTIEIYAETVTQEGNSGITITVDQETKAQVSWSKKLLIGQVGATGKSLTIGTEAVQVGTNLSGEYSLTLDFGERGMSISFDTRSYLDQLVNSIGSGLANPAFNPMYFIPPLLGGGIMIPL